MEKTLLAGWLKNQGISDAVFAERIRRDPVTVWRWKTGRGKPDITSAVIIERETDNAVPCEAWADLGAPA